MTDPNRARQLALLLQAVTDLEMERAEFMTEWKDRRLRLENQISDLRRTILSGQMELITESEKSA